MLTTELGAQLRQGDVCTVRDFPKWKLDSPRVDTASPVLLVVEAWGRPIRSADGGALVVVCSYDCDLENPRNRSGVLLAPLVKLPASDGSPEAARIIASATVEDGKLGYANFFPLPLRSAEAAEEQWAVADFSSMATLASAKEAIAALTSTRSHTMTDETRIWFQTKLSLFLHRPGN